MAGSGRKDPYRALGVSSSASDDEIKKSYRELARRFHPDVNADDPNAEERFKEISEAYARLSSPEKRQAFDEFGEIALDPNFDPESARRARDAFGSGFREPPPGGSQEGFGSGLGFDGIGDLFGDLFGRARGGRGGASGRARGPDLSAELQLDFLEAARGGEKRLVVSRPSAMGELSSETVTVRIPAGVADGGRIRIPGKGGAGIGGGPAGDLYATLRVGPHPVFDRRGRNLLLDLPVSVSEATLGAKIEIPTLDGRATVTLPPGTDSGQRLRLRQKGIPNPSGGPPGDLYVTVHIQVPKNLDDEGRKAVEALADHEPDDLRKHL